MKIKITTVLFSLASTLTLSACVNLEDKIHTNHKEMRTEYKPSIYKNITNFSKSLSCMDQLLTNPKIKRTSILIESLNDKTHQVKAGTRDMLISAISDMTKKSKKIKIITYGKDSANLISFLKTARKGNVYKNIPQYDIRGSISQYDKNIVQADHSLGLFLRSKLNGGLGKSKAASLDVMTLDLSAVDTHDMSVVPGVTSKNTIAILSKGNSLDADARIKKLGIYFDMTLSRSEGKSQALRNLIELASIEIIGKLTRVPYWECLGARAPENILDFEEEYTSPARRTQPEGNSKKVTQSVKAHSKKPSPKKVQLAKPKLTHKKAPIVRGNKTSAIKTNIKKNNQRKAPLIKTKTLAKAKPVKTTPKKHQVQKVSVKPSKKARGLDISQKQWEQLQQLYL
ncbi:MAG: hypothetical protein KAH22_12105 [Thiotrichaceae bacterium]|nr:hypothetical protein [Thiotrichaceae bacterium]